jgi:S1-C subfamily serine protease
VSLTGKDYTMRSVKDYQRLLPDLERLELRLNDELTAKLLSECTIKESNFESRGSPQDEVEDISTSLKLIESGKVAIRKIRAQGDKVQLTDEDKLGLEAIICITARPAILIEDGKIGAIPSEWSTIESCRERIERVAKSVGRIEVDGHPTLSWIGTGFLIAEQVIATNRHVASEFCSQGAYGWQFKPKFLSGVNFKRDFGSTSSDGFKITDIVGVHKTLDLALLRVTETSTQGTCLPPSLSVVSPDAQITAPRKVYIIGHPAKDMRNDPIVMQKVFEGIYGSKRLQPGEITHIDLTRSLFKHDCSTLGGNSGSCVIDVESHSVLGIHFRGTYGKANYAISLWTLAGDKFFKKVQVNFA